MYMKSKRILFILLCLLCLMHIQPVHAETGYQAVLNDRADLLTETEEKLLLQQMWELTAYGNVMFVSGYCEGSTAASARSFYNERFGTDSGTILLIDMENRIIYIHSEGDVSKVITNAYADAITDNSYRHATNGEYYRCASDIFAQEKTLLSGGKISRPMKHITNLLISVLAALLLNFLFLTLSRSPKEDDTVTPSDMITAGGLSVTVLKAVKISEKKRHSPMSSGGSSSGGSSGGYSGGSSGGYSGGSSSGGGSSGSGGGHRF